MNEGRQAEVDMLIVLDYPKFQDDENNQVFSDKKHEYLREILQDVVRIDWDAVRFTYALKCRTDKAVKPADVNTCSSLYLHKEIEAIQPKVILTLGDNATRAVLGEVDKVSKIHGIEAVNDLWPEIKVIPTYSPGYVEHVDGLVYAFANDINTAWMLAKGIKKELPTRIKEVESIEEVNLLMDYVEEVGRAAFDFETEGLEIAEDSDQKATCLSISFQHGSSWVIPLEHHEHQIFSAKEIKKIFKILKTRFFENPHIRKIAHNFKFDQHIAARYGVQKFRGRFDDTMTMHHLIDETTLQGLKPLVAYYYPQYAGYEEEVERYVKGQDSKEEDWTKVPWHVLCPYAGTDTDMTLRLCDLFEIKLLEDERSYNLYRSLTMVAIKPLYQAEHRGIKIDRPFLEKAIVEVEAMIKVQEEKLRTYPQVQEYVATVLEIKKLEAIAELEEKIENSKSAHHKARWKEQIRKLKTGEDQIEYEFNFGSWQQKSGLLYSRAGFGYKMMYNRKTDKEGGTSKKVLMYLDDYSGFIEDLFVYGTYMKMWGTYLVGVLNRLDKHDRIHTTYLQHGTKTGRLSSRNPNLQNIPNLAKLKDEGAIRIVGYIKKMFVPDEDHVFLQLDYSQAELRLIADYSGDRVMLDAYAKGLDLHIVTAANILGMSVAAFMKLPADEQKKWRTRAKAGNFGLIYGMGVDGFIAYAKENYQVTLSKEEATRIRNNFFKLYNALPVYHDTYIRKARQFGQVRTLFGRRRHLLEIDSPDDFRRSLDERAAVNSPIQGSAGEITLFGMALLYFRLPEGVTLANTVHDSLMYCVPKHLVAETARIMQETCENLPMEKFFGKGLKAVTMKTDLEHSEKSWKDLEKYAA